MTEQDLKGLIASDLIIVATETKGKMPSKLNFTELIDVVTDVVKNCSIHVVSNTEGKLFCENVIHHTCKHFDTYNGCMGCLVKDFEAK